MGFEIDERIIVNLLGRGYFGGEMVGSEKRFRGINQHSTKLKLKNLIDR